MAGKTAPIIGLVNLYLLMHNKYRENILITLLIL